MARLVDPGELATRLMLERPVRSPDGQGGAEVSFEAVTMLSGRIEPVSVGLEEEGAQRRAIASHRILIRFRSDVAAGMRLVKQDRIFAIRGVIDADGRGRYLICHVEEDLP